LIGKVDCDQEGALATKNGVNKYPTLKLFRHGVAIKKEYRGARSVDAFLAYIKEQIADSIKEVNSLPDLFTLEVYIIRNLSTFYFFANFSSFN
jgi:endoplasmic reticulum resident protein 44